MEGTVFTGLCLSTPGWIHQSGYPIQDRSGYPQPVMGYPTKQNSRAITCYVVGGMPLVFTQEDFLVTARIQRKVLFSVFQFTPWWGGYPHPVPIGSTPSFQKRGYLILPSGGHGYPILPIGMGYLILPQGGHPCPDLEGYPRPDLGSGTLLPWPGVGVPPSWPGIQIPLVLTWDGVHPSSWPRRGGGGPNWNSIACTCYATGGMPLAFTQDDFLAHAGFEVVLDNSLWKPNCFAPMISILLPEQTFQ